MRVVVPNNPGPQGLQFFFENSTRALVPAFNGPAQRLSGPKLPGHQRALTERRTGDHLEPLPGAPRDYLSGANGARGVDAVAAAAAAPRPRLRVRPPPR